LDQIYFSEIFDFTRIPIPKETFGFTQEAIFQTAEASHRIDHVKGYDGISSAADDMRENLIEKVYKEHRLHESVMEADLVTYVGRKPLAEKLKLNEVSIGGLKYCGAKHAQQPEIGKFCVLPISSKNKRLYRSNLICI
jgi:hypothetical protein